MEFFTWGTLIISRSKFSDSLILAVLKDRGTSFASERDWDQFHSPKNLAIALSVEAGELLEQFQWIGDLESASPSSGQRVRIAEEIADMLLYLIRLADKLDINLVEAAHSKLQINALKYPVDRARGSSKKYTEL